MFISFNGNLIVDVHITISVCHSQRVSKRFLTKLVKDIKKTIN